jgi:hypothetical protein
LPPNLRDAEQCITKADRGMTAVLVEVTLL